MIVPRTLCGLPIDSRGQQADQADLGATEANLSASGIGYRSGVSEGYETPNGTDARSYRFINYLGITGRFNPAQAMSVLEGGTDENYRSVPAGPHGGLMACAEQYHNVADCVWATPTTLCSITIEDTSLQLVRTHADANAIRIRAVVEVLA